MAKVNCIFENDREIPPKVLAMYRAVMELINEGVEIADMKVFTITDRAGIGKGTAYEYFESKDEIVACAVVYCMQRIFQHINEELAKKETFMDQFDLLMDEAEKAEAQKVSFFRFIHMLTDGSEFCKLVRSKLNSEHFEEYLPLNFMKKMIVRAKERGEITSQASEDYLVCFLMAQMMNYTLFFAMDGEMIDVDAATMRENIRASIMNELKIGKTLSK